MSLIIPESPTYRKSFCYQRVDRNTFREVLPDAPWNYISVGKCAIVIFSWMKTGIEHLIHITEIPNETKIFSLFLYSVFSPYSPQLTLLPAIPE